MNTRTPPVSPGDSSPTRPDLTAQATQEGSAALNGDGLDLRRYLSLTPLEQLERLEADNRALTATERARSKAARELKVMGVRIPSVAPADGSATGSGIGGLTAPPAGIHSNGKEKCDGR